MRREHSLITETPVLPDEYTELQYIEGTGTQYIDTGLSAPNGFGFDLNFMFTQAQGNAYIVGSHNKSAPYGRNGVQSAAYNAYTRLWGEGTGDTIIFSHPDSPAFQKQTYIQYNVNQQYHIVGQTIKGNSYLNVDGELLLHTTDNSTRSSSNILFFTEQYTLNRGQAKTRGRLIGRDYLIIDGTVYTFIPAKRNQDNKPGLYLHNNNTFLTNQGTGEFLYI